MKAWHLELNKYSLNLLDTFKTLSWPRTWEYDTLKNQILYQICINITIKYSRFISTHSNAQGLFIEWINELSWQRWTKRRSEWISFSELPWQIPTGPVHQARVPVAAGTTDLCSWQREVHILPVSCWADVRLPSGVAWPWMSLNRNKTWDQKVLIISYPKWLAFVVGY